MGINNLFRQLKDIQYQADKILKSKLVEQEAITHFSEYTRSIKQSLIEMGLNEDLAIHVNDIEHIDPQYEPKVPVMTRISSALTFGYSAKKYRNKKREQYFRELVKDTKAKYHHIDFLLKEI